MTSSRRRVDDRRAIFLSLASQIGSQLREEYARKYEASLLTQSSIAERLGINRSAVHHRLMGHTNMTTETIADMVWALGCAISVKIYDPAEVVQREPYLPYVQEYAVPSTARPAPAEPASVLEATIHRHHIVPQSLTNAHDQWQLRRRATRDQPSLASITRNNVVQQQLWRKYGATNWSRH